MGRCVVLFAREPGREARAKGLPEGAALFSGLARAWRLAAAESGARLVLSTPPEDVATWRRFSFEPCRPQRGGSFGERLENAARDAAAAAGSGSPIVLVGGDVPASAALLAEAFAALEGGADAVLAPAPDGGVSLVSVAEVDVDLLRAIRPRRKVYAALRRALCARGRRVATVAPLPDVDGRRSLAVLAEALAPGELRSLARLALISRHAPPEREASPSISRDPSRLPALRAPPAA